MPAGLFATTMAGIGQQAAGAGMGMLLGRYNDRRQLEQQKKLSDMQAAQDRAMTDYQAKTQLQMWKDTSYGAQMEQMKKAGINPALMYGMGGGGGQSMGGGAASTHGASAPQGGGEIGMGMQMGLQTAMMQAQVELAKAQAKKTNVEAENIGAGGIDTQVKQMGIANLAQGIKNAKANERLTDLQGDIAEVQKEVAQGTVENAIAKIGVEMQIANRLFENMTRQGWIDENTKFEKVKIVREELTRIGLENGLTKARTGEIGSNIQVNNAQISKWATEIQQRWAELGIQGENAETNRMNANTGAGRLAWDKLIHDISDSTKLTVETVGRVVGDVMKAVGAGKVAEAINNKKK